MPIESHLHVWEDRFLCTSDYLGIGLTDRVPLSLLVSATGQPFALTVPGHGAWRGSAMLVAPQVRCQLEADVIMAGTLLSLDMDPCLPAWRTLMGAMGEAPVVPLQAQAFDRLRERLGAALRHRLAGPALRALSDAMLQAACLALGIAPEAVPLDARVAAMLQRMKDEAVHGAVPLHWLAQQSCLSPDRVTHLFREQTGLSIKRYLLWLKVRRALPHIHAGCPLTQCAQLGGFTDAAHMSRAFRQLFGVAPSHLTGKGGLRLHMHCTVRGQGESIR